MKINQYGHYQSYINGKKDKSFMVQLVLETKTYYEFKINNNNSEILTISKKTFPEHKWYSDKNRKIEHKTIIEMYDNK